MYGRGQFHDEAPPKGGPSFPPANLANQGRLPGDDWFRALAENSPLSMTVLRNGTISWANAATARLFGYDGPSSLAGVRFLDLVDPLGQAGAIDWEGHLDREGLLDMSYQTVGVTKQGTQLLLGVQFSPMVLPDGPATMVYLIDNTEHRKWAEALREEEARFRTVWENAADAMALSDSGGFVIYANPACCNLYGYSPEEIVGKDFSVIFPEDERGRAREEYTRVFRGEVDAPVFAVRARRPDGTERIVEARVAFVPQRGQERLMLSIMRDVTEQKRAEQFRDEYLSLISHDLRGPLTSMKGYAELLHRSFSGQGMEKEIQQTQAIVKGANRMNAMINDLVETVRLESGQQDLHRESVDLRVLLAEVVEQSVPPEDHSRVRVELPGEAVIASVDTICIERVVTNLISNALKFSPDGADVRIALSSSGDQALISVTDKGAGIPPGDQAKLFNRFYQASAEGKTSGLGLGLYIARMLVEAHGGGIRVDSKVGVGSTFYVSLPR